MKKSKKTQLTALMFAAALGVGSTGCIPTPYAVYGPPPESDATNTSETIDTQIEPSLSQETEATAATGTTAASSTATGSMTSGSFASRQTTTQTINTTDDSTESESGMSLTEDTTEPESEMEMVAIYGPPEWNSTEDPTEPTEPETEPVTEPIYGPPEWFH